MACFLDIFLVKKIIKIQKNIYRIKNSLSKVLAFYGLYMFLPKVLEREYTLTFHNNVIFCFIYIFCQKYHTENILPKEV